MKKKSFKVPIYDFNVTVVQIEKDDSWKAIKNLLPKDLPNECLDEIQDCVAHYEDNWDGGWTITKVNTIKSALIIFTGFSSTKKKANVISHEKRHLEDKILNFCNIDDREAAAYLAGYLAEELMWVEELNTNIL